MGGARKGSKKKRGNHRKKPSRPPPPSPPPSSSVAPSAEDATATATARDDDDDDEAVEESVLSELRTKCRSLLASLGGVAPDGAPFAEEGHPLFDLRASVEDLTVRLIEAQRKRTSRRMRGEEEDASKKFGTDGGVDAATTKDVEEGEGRAAGAGGTRDDPKVRESFESWLETCGIIGSSVSNDEFLLEMRKSSFGYGLFATRDVGHDEVVLRIPLSCAVCPYWRHRLEDDDDDDDDDAPPVRRPPPFDPNRPPSSDGPYKPLCLVTHLANERWKGSRSKVKPYLDALPTSYDTPLFWSHDETTRSLMDVTDHRKRCVAQRALTVWEYIRMRDAIALRHAEIASSSAAEEDLIPTAEFTYELYRWATGAAHTRQNLLPYLSKGTNDEESVEGGGEEVREAYGLVPLWDMLNHEDSDRSCRSEVVFVGDEGEDDDRGVDDERRRRRTGEAVLVCRTPPRRPNDAEDAKGTDAPSATSPCFRRGEEVTMHYGDRSNAQLLFHSGFVNGELLLPPPSSNGATTEGKQRCVNRNRTDRALLRLALPPAACDGKLDRVREMIAAKFGFRAYVDQGCDHDGTICAEISAQVAREFREGGGGGGNGEEDRDNEGATTKIGPTTARDSRSVVMTEIPVSPSDDRPPMELARALILCVADRDELNDILRNMDRYATTAEDDEGGGKDESESFPLLTQKHVRLASMLVQAKNKMHEARVTRFRERRGDVWKGAGGGGGGGSDTADRLALELACCDNVTLNAWLEAFESQVTTTTTNAGAAAKKY